MALDAVGWTGLTFNALKIEPDFILITLSFTFTWLFYTKDRLEISTADSENNPTRTTWYAHQKHLKKLMVLASFLILGCLLMRLTLLLPAFIGIVPCLFYTKTWTYQHQTYTLKGLPGMKVVLVSFLWVLLTIGFPLSTIPSNLPPTNSILDLSLMVGFFIMLQIHTNDLRDMGGDAKAHIHSFAVLLGDKKARLLGLLFIGVGIYFGWGLFNPAALLFFGLILALRTLFYRKEYDIYWQVVISLQGVFAYFILS